VVSAPSLVNDHERLRLSFAMVTDVQEGEVASKALPIPPISGPARSTDFLPYESAIAPKCGTTNACMMFATESMADT
jgi:hypothetical protein